MLVNLCLFTLYICPSTSFLRSAATSHGFLASCCNSQTGNLIWRVFKERKPSVNNEQLATEHYQVAVMDMEVLQKQLLLLQEQLRIKDEQIKQRDEQVSKIGAQLEEKDRAIKEKDTFIFDTIVNDRASPKSPKMARTESNQWIKKIEALEGENKKLSGQIESLSNLLAKLDESGKATGESSEEKTTPNLNRRNSRGIQNKNAIVQKPLPSLPPGGGSPVVPPAKPSPPSSVSMPSVRYLTLKLLSRLLTSSVERTMIE